MNLYFEVAADRSSGALEPQHGSFHTTYLGDDGASDKSVAFAVMADGVKGHAGGQIASNLVVSTFNRSVARGIGSASFPGVLRESMAAANSALGDAIGETPDLKGMACTVVGALLVAGRLHWASVGDLIVLLVRQGKLRRLNADHSYGAFLEQARAQGVDATPEPGLTPDMLMSAVTGEPLSEMDCPNQGVDLEDGDRIIFASRTLKDVDDADILKASRAASAPRDAIASLDALAAGTPGEAPDNSTLIVIDVRDRDPKPAPVKADKGSAAVAPAAAVEPPRPSLLLNLLTGLGSVVILVAAAAGTWFGLAEVEAWRAASRPDARGRVEVVTTPPAVSTVSTAPDTGLSSGTSAMPSLPAPGSSDSGSGGGLSFGAPAPLTMGGAPPAPAAPAATPAGDGARDALVDGGEGPLMVSLPGGTFQMGASSQSASPASRPRHEVTVRPFSMSVHEVSVAQYQRFAKATGRAMPDLRIDDPEMTPMSRVTWDDAYAFTIWLSRQTGKKYRLPSEAEWEYAARGGTSTRFWWGNSVGKERAHCFDCDTGLNTRRASRVGRFAPNPFGLHDTAGNLAEWVHDCWHPNYRGAPADGAVWEGGDCQSRVVRGGGFSSTSKSMDSSAREAVPAGRALDTMGFRVARDP